MSTGDKLTQSLRRAKSKTEAVKPKQTAKPKPATSKDTQSKKVTPKTNDQPTQPVAQSAPSRVGFSRRVWPD